MAKPAVQVTKTSNTHSYLRKIAKVGNIAVFVGIPSSSPRTRVELIRKRARKFTSPAKKSKASKKRIFKLANLSSLTSAEILAIYSKGSPLTGQPARPVLGPALMTEETRERVSLLVAQASQEYVNGRVYKAKELLKKAGVVGSKAARDWFKDSRNQWASNSPSTISKKKRDEPGINTGVMRAAITYEIREVAE